MGKEKKINIICIALTCCPFSPLFLTCRPDLSFFFLLLIALIDLGAAVVFEMLGSCGMGEGKADCTKSRHSSRLEASF